jgi:hypothetical protein
VVRSRASSIDLRPSDHNIARVGFRVDGGRIADQNIAGCRERLHAPRVFYGNPLRRMGKELRSSERKDVINDVREELEHRPQEVREVGELPS